MPGKNKQQALDDHAPWKPPKFTDADVAAIQALAKGSASRDQQQRALDWIVNQACGTYDFPFRPGSDDRDTNIALGRLFAGQQIVKLIKIKIGLLRREE